MLSQNPFRIKTHVTMINYPRKSHEIAEQNIYGRGQPKWVFYMREIAGEGRETKGERRETREEGTGDRRRGGGRRETISPTFPPHKIILLGRIFRPVC